MNSHIDEIYIKKKKKLISYNPKRVLHNKNKQTKHNINKQTEKISFLLSAAGKK